MKIVIAGCGKIGTTVVASLVSEGHDVVVIDKKESVVSEITDIYDVMGVIGSSTDCDVLSEAGIEKAELFSSFTDSDELNMLSCFLAKKMGAKHTIARIRNPEYNDKSLGFMRQQLDLSMAINPERLAARELFNILKLPSSVKIETFSRSNLELIEIKLKDDSVIAGKKLTEIRDKYKAKFLVCTVQRGGNIYIPDGNFVLRGGDKIGITASPQEIQKLFKALGMTQRSAKSVMILGGSRTAYYLAKILTATGNSVKIIEQDKRLCDDICTWIPKAVVINGDGAQQELLIEEGIRSVDAFVALTGLDEENILISIFALSQKVPKVISKINRDELESMAGELGLDCVISPKRTVADILVGYARALKNSLGSNVETLYNLMDGKAEALEFNVSSDFKYVNIPLKELKLKPNIIVSGIIRDRKPIIPDGDDYISAGDKVIVISVKRKLNDLSDILK